MINKEQINPTAYLGIIYKDQLSSINKLETVG